MKTKSPKFQKIEKAKPYQALKLGSGKKPETYARVAKKVLVGVRH